MDVIDGDSMTRMRALAACVKDIRTEQTAQVEAAAEIEALTAHVCGEESAPVVPAAPAEGEELAEPVTAATEACRPGRHRVGRTRDDYRVRCRRPAVPCPQPVRRPPAQPHVLPEASPPGTTIAVAVDLSGYTPGAGLNFDDVVKCINSRAAALKTAGVGSGG
uniref:Uncharacterized protein n=1 Tax=Streptomyces sp. NBC_01393 TaxID=2903851 RepID=A0AAU3HPP7_9ACTN